MNRVLDKFDCEAILEGYAVQEHRELTIQSHGRDDNRIRSKHRAERVDATHCRSTIKHGRNDKEVNLQSRNVHARLAIAMQKQKLKKLEKQFALQK